jgi:hypothetical protein
MADPQLPGGWLPPQAPTGAAEPPRSPGFVAPPAEQGMDGLAIAALVCALTSLALLVISLGLSFVLSLPLALTGWVCASRSGRPGAGRTLSIIAVALSVAAAVVWLGLMAAGFTPEELQRSLEQELQRQRRSS